MRKIDVSLTPFWRICPPSSIVLVTCITQDGKPNIITIGMNMPISAKPPLIAIGVSPRRYSHRLIEETGEFVVNVPPKGLVKQVILCGTISGREHEKFEEAGLTPIAASKVKPPLIKECISHMECRVAAEYKCGDHTLFIGEVVATHINEGYLKGGELDVLKAEPPSHRGRYYFTPHLIFKA
ncbi:MAG: protein of DIM6/NTAB family [Candidatus Bathyarchaeota archaeon B63]|nr:MAG: protein of DIM6/NTAB family [Candidatus Bathyarchaeota archaeon B63]